MKIEDIDKEFHELSNSLKQGEEAYQRGDTQLAQELLERTLTTIKSFGDQHPDADACISRLADVYYSRRRYSDAISLLRELYQRRAEQLGSSHPSLMSVMFRTARCYERQSMYREAEREYLRALSYMNETGMPDRPAAANIVESYARMLRSIEGRTEEGEQLEEQARDLRNLTREKLNLEIINNIAFDGIECVDITTDLNETRAGIGNLRRRTGADTLEQKSPSRKNLIFAVVAAAVLLIAAGAFVAWKVTSEEETRKSKQAAAAAHAANRVIKPRSETLKTVDGMEQLILFDNGDATYVCAGASTRGKFSEQSGSLNFKVADSPKTSLMFSKDPSGYADQNGVVLYRPEARELDVVNSMRKIASSLRASYHAGGGYLPDVPTYQNAFTSKTEAPLIKNIGSMERRVNFEQLERFQSEVQKIITWTEWSTGRPGFIELYHYASGDDGDTLYIKGTDGQGRYLRSSAPQNAYLFKLVDGELK